MNAVTIEDRFVFDDEHARQLFGDRYNEFKERFERAVNSNNLDDLADWSRAAEPQSRR